MTTPLHNLVLRTVPTKICLILYAIIGKPSISYTNEEQNLILYLGKYSISQFMSHKGMP